MKANGTRYESGWNVPKQRNSWECKDLPNPLITAEEAFDILHSHNPKTYRDPTTTVGDIIIDYKRSAKIHITYYQCPACLKVFSSWQDAVDHVQEVNSLTSRKNSSEEEFEEHPPVGLQEIVEHIKEETLTNVYIFYEVIRPEEVLPFPESVEWNEAKDETRVPTAESREQHDKLVEEWRKQMMETRHKRKLHIEVLPNGKTFLQSPSDSWYYYCPQIYLNGEWVTLGVEDLPTLDENNTKTRVLFLRGIIPVSEIGFIWEE